MKKKSKLCLSVLLIGALFSACKKDEIAEQIKDPSGQNVSKPETVAATQAAAAATTPSYAFDSNTNSKLMYADGEILDSLTSVWRTFEIGKMLRVKPVDRTTIEVANFAPVDITDATILLNISGLAKTIKLFHISKIRAHGVQRIKYPFTQGILDYFATDNSTVNLSAYSSGINHTSVTFNFTGTAPTVSKLKALSVVKWKIKFNDFDPNNNDWQWKDTPTAKDFRMTTGALINLAYFYSTQTYSTYRSAFLNEPITGNDGVTFLTSAQKQSTYQGILDKSNLGVGIPTSVNGLASPSRLGYAEHVLAAVLTSTSYYTTMVHEIGHVAGYNHDSSMTYEKDGRGATAAAKPIWESLFNNGQFPVLRANYYKSSDLP